MSPIITFVIAAFLFIITLNLQSIDHKLTDILEELRKEQK